MKVINNIDKISSLTVADMFAGDYFIRLGGSPFFLMTDSRHIIVDIETGRCFNYIEEGWSSDIVIPLDITATITKKGMQI